MRTKTTQLTILMAMATMTGGCEFDGVLDQLAAACAGGPDAIRHAIEEAMGNRDGRQEELPTVTTYEAILQDPAAYFQATVDATLAGTLAQDPGNPAVGTAQGSIQGSRPEQLAYLVQLDYRTVTAGELAADPFFHQYVNGIAWFTQQRLVGVQMPGPADQAMANVFGMDGIKLAVAQYLQSNSQQVATSLFATGNDCFVAAGPQAVPCDVVALTAFILAAGANQLHIGSMPGLDPAPSALADFDLAFDLGLVGPPGGPQEGPEPAAEEPPPGDTDEAPPGDTGDTGDAPESDTDL